MSGHSKWATIKRKKEKTDQQKGKIFSKLAREITTAAKIGGGDPAMNPRLRLAIDKAKSMNLPNSNVDRAIEKGTGGGEGTELEEILYEGYGPAGVAIMVSAITDNKIRTVSEIRFIFNRHGGSLGAAGCVSYLFKKHGQIIFDKSKYNEEEIVNLAISAGALDIQSDENTLEIVTDPANFEKVLKALKDSKFEPASAEISMLPSTTVAVTGEDAAKVMELVTELSEHDDVQNVYSNFDVPDDIAS